MRSRGNCCLNVNWARVGKNDMQKAPTKTKKPKHIPMFGAFPPPPSFYTVLFTHLSVVEELPIVLFYQPAANQRTLYLHSLMPSTGHTSASHRALSHQLGGSGPICSPGAALGSRRWQMSYPTQKAFAWCQRLCTFQHSTDPQAGCSPPEFYIKLLHVVEDSSSHSDGFNISPFFEAIYIS